MVSPMTNKPRFGENRYQVRDKLGGFGVKYGHPRPQETGGEGMTECRRQNWCHMSNISNADGNQYTSGLVHMIAGIGPKGPATTIFL